MQNLENAIRQRAYQLWKERGCRIGCALEDWLEAQAEVERAELALKDNVRKLVAQAKPSPIEAQLAYLQSIMNSGREGLTKFIEDPQAHCERNKIALSQEVIDILNDRVILTRSTRAMAPAAVASKASKISALDAVEAALHLVAMAI
jgi:hypothetical protein